MPHSTSPVRHSGHMTVNVVTCAANSGRPSTASSTSSQPCLARPRLLRSWLSSQPSCSSTAPTDTPALHLPYRPPDANKTTNKMQRRVHSPAPQALSRPWACAAAKARGCTGTLCNGGIARLVLGTQGWPGQLHSSSRPRAGRHSLAQFMAEPQLRPSTKRHGSLSDGSQQPLAGAGRPAAAALQALNMVLVNCLQLCLV